MNNYGDYNMGQRPNWDRMRPSNMGQGCPDITTIEIYSRGAIETVICRYFQIDLKEGEYLSCMRGYIILNYQGLPCISQIIFETNLGKYGPYGRGSGTPFALPVLEGKIVGFFGRAGDYITSIGCYIMPN
ncbi:hypothetical protein ZIOFF_016820 [Zingiber officinale]|uniref:Jacalin-type lectin domain-containing protein n=1 Tax=Zingiber officinale TaxID=94328 RepID=A0A8J5HWN2_ZINOF|nr:hypothetical protein ZIOFF_016820 [Zingiber officinale]